MHTFFVFRFQVYNNEKYTAQEAQGAACAADEADITDGGDALGTGNREQEGGSQDSRMITCLRPYESVVYMRDK